jgi:hypothetical protein
VTDSRTRAEHAHKAATKDFNKARNIKAANRKLDKLLAEPSGWGAPYGTYGDLLKRAERGEAPPHGKLRIGTVTRYVERTRKGKLWSKGDVDYMTRAIKALGFESVWRSEARRLKYAAPRPAPRKTSPAPAPAPTPAPSAPAPTKLTPAQVEVVGTPERFEALKALGEADTDPRGYWNRSFRAVRDGWNISDKWKRAIKRSLDKEAKKTAAPAASAPSAPASKPIAPRDGDTITAVGEVCKVERFEIDRARYPHSRVSVKTDDKDLVVMYKEYNGSVPKCGTRLRVIGKAGWTMDRRAEGRPLFVALNGRKKIEHL